MALLDLLKRMEWQGYNGGGSCCPECLGDAPSIFPPCGHKPDCELKATIDRITTKIAARATVALERAEAEINAQGAAEAEADGFHAQCD